MAKLAGEPIPDRIKDKPKLYSSLDFILDAFLELDTDRNINTITGPIPWTSIRSYADELGLRDSMRDEFFYVMRKVDNAYIKHLGKKHGGFKGPSK